MIDTRIPGSPADIVRASEVLRRSIGDGAATLADDAAAARGRLAVGWTGLSGGGFQDAAGTLVRAADTFCGSIQALATEMATLGERLDEAQSRMQAARATAARAGLSVSDDGIRVPTSGGEGFDQRARCYEECADRAREAWETWGEALADYTDAVDRHASTISTTLAQLLTAGYGAHLLGRTSRVMQAQAEVKRAEARRYRGYADDLVSDLREGRVKPHSTTYSELDELVRQSHEAGDEAAEAANSAQSVKLPVPLTVGLKAVGPLAAIYSYYDDRGRGESREQALASQGGGLAAGMLAGSITGGAIGTMGFPIVGTVAGAAVGAAAGIYTNSRVDEHYENTVAAEQLETARDARTEKTQLVQELLNAREGLPLFSTPGSSNPMYDEEW